MKIRVHFSCGRCRVRTSAVVEDNRRMAVLRELLATEHRKGSPGCQARGKAINIIRTDLVREPPYVAPTSVDVRHDEAMPV